MQSQLAIHGGAKSIPDGVLSSPPTTALDEEMVLKSLRSGAHAWGENCEALQREWAAWNGNRHCVALSSGTAAQGRSRIRFRCGCAVLCAAISGTFTALSSGCARASFQP